MNKMAFGFGCALLGLFLLATAGQERVEAEDKAPIKTSKERAADRESRVWTTSDQNYTAFARLLSFDGKLVTLRKGDGRTVTLPLDKLTKDDQDYVANEFGGSPKSETSATPKADPTAPASRESDDPSELESKCRELCEQIASSYDGRSATQKPTIAVVEFSNLSGGVSDLGKLLSEELITRLFATKNYKVIERLLLNKAIAEHKLQLQGLVDPKSAKELGKILGVDAIVSGTIADLGDSLRVNARVISTETGELLSVAAVTLGKEKLPKLEGVNSSGGASGADYSADTPIKLPFREDFSGYEDGKTTNWGPNGKVVTGEDGRKWLVPVQKGQKPVGINVDLPSNAYVEFEYSAYPLESNREMPHVLSGITLVDEAGTKFRIEFVVSSRDYVFKLPGGATAGDESYDGRYLAGTVLVRKAGNSVTVWRANKESRSLTADLSDFKKITRIEVDLYKGTNCQIAFTNFKIGSAGGGSKAPERRSTDPFAP